MDSGCLKIFGFVGLKRHIVEKRLDVTLVDNGRTRELKDRATRTLLRIRKNWYLYNMIYRQMNVLIKCSTISILISGNYSCVPSYATPAWVLVTVIQGVFSSVFKMSMLSNEHVSMHRIAVRVYLWALFANLDFLNSLLAPLCNALQCRAVEACYDSHNKVDIIRGWAGL